MPRQKNQTISNNPEEVKSHYETISLPSKSGQARYRCKKCGYELECTGRGRLIAHVVGSAFPSTEKQVKFCTNPEEALKAALIKFMQTEKFRSRSKYQTKRSRSKALQPPLSPSTPQQQLPLASEPDSSCFSQSEFVLGKRKRECLSSAPPQKHPSPNPPDSDGEDCDTSTKSELSDQSGSLSCMNTKNLLSLLNILRIMNPQQFDLALRLHQANNHLSAQQYGLPMVYNSYYHLLLSQEISIRQLQSQLLYESLFSPLLRGSNELHSMQSHLNSMITSALFPSQGISEPVNMP